MVGRVDLDSEIPEAMGEPWWLTDDNLGPPPGRLTGQTDTTFHQIKVEMKEE